jgi:hypothetical protein
MEGDRIRSNLVSVKSNLGFLLIVTEETEYESILFLFYASFNEEML